MKASKRVALAFAAGFASLVFLSFQGFQASASFVLRPSLHTLHIRRLKSNTAREASNGFLLFNAEESAKEKFLLEKLFELVRELPKEFAALDWQPPDSRGTRYFNSQDKQNCVRYFAAGKPESWPDPIVKIFKSQGSGCLVNRIKAFLFKSEEGETIVWATLSQGEGTNESWENATRKTILHSGIHQEAQTRSKAASCSNEH